MPARQIIPWRQPTTTTTTTTTPAVYETTTETIGPQEVARTRGGYGHPIPWGYGDMAYTGNIIWLHRVLTADNRASFMLSLFRPVVPDRTRYIVWIKANGIKIHDTTGAPFSADGVSFRFYPGSTTQQPDPFIVSVDGEGNVPGWRYQCCVFFENYDISEGMPEFVIRVADATAPANTATDFTQVNGDTADTRPAVDWRSGTMYSYSDTLNLIRGYSLQTLTEVSWATLIELDNSYHSYSERIFHYIPQYGLIFTIGFQTIGSEYYGVLIDPLTGQTVAESASELYSTVTAAFTQTVAIVAVDGEMLAVGGVYLQGRVWVARFTQDEVEAVYDSGAGWNGASNDADGGIQSIAPGLSLGATAEVFISADDEVYRTVVNATGVVSSTLIASFAGVDVRKLYYSESDDSVVVWLADGDLVKVAAENGDVIYSTTTPYVFPNAETSITGDLQTHRIFNNEMAVISTANVYVTNLASGSTTTSAISPSLFMAARQVYDGVTRASYHTDTGSEPFRVAIGGDPDGTYSLETGVRELGYSVGFEIADFSFTNIPDEVVGLKISQSVRFRDFEVETAAAFNYDFYESGGVIKHVRPVSDGAFALAATLDETDLIMRDGEDARIVTTNRKQDIDIPRRFELQYFDRELDFEIGKQQAQRPLAPYPSMGSYDTDILRTSWAMSADQAVRSRHVALFRAWEAQLFHSFSVGLQFAWLEPTDILLLDLEDYTWTAKAVRVEFNTEDGTQTIQAENYLSEVATTVSGHSGSKVEAPRLGYQASRYIHLDVPLLSVTDDTDGEALVQYSVVTSLGFQDWTGGTSWFSRDGQSYSALANQTRHPTVGVVVGTLADTTEDLNLDPAYIEDTVNDLVVAISSGDGDDLEDFAGETISAPGMICAVGRPGRWEIILPQAVTENANGTWTIEAPFYRGLAGTDIFTGTHAAGDLFVVIRGEYLDKHEYLLTDLGDSLYYKATGAGQSRSAVTATRETVSGAAEKPYAPIVTATLDSPDIDLTWVRGSRLEKAYGNATELSEDSQSYEIDLIDDDLTTVLDTLTGIVTTSRTLTDAEITAAYGSTPPFVRLRVYQISGSVGRGYSRLTTVATEPLTADTTDYTADTTLITADAG